MQEPSWQELYKAALLEGNPEKVNDRVRVARHAVYERLMEDKCVTQEEREKINDALRKLYLLTGGSGSA
jgi:hypothetical protein